MRWLQFGANGQRWFLAYDGTTRRPPDVYHTANGWCLIPYTSAMPELLSLSQRVGPFSTLELAQAAAEAIYETGIDLFEEYANG